MTHEGEVPLPISLGRGDRLTWDGATVHAAKLLAKDRARVDEIAALCADPRVRALSQLTVTFKTRRGAAAIARLAGALPPEIRALQLGEPEGDYVEDMTGVQLLGVAARLVPELRQLESLALHGPLFEVKVSAPSGIDNALSPLLAGNVRTLAHPRLAELTLGELAGATPALMTLHADSLPALRRLVVTARYPQMESIDSLCFAVGRGGLLAQLSELTLAGTCTGAGTDLLAAALGDRRIPRLELRVSTIADDVRARFAGLCDELICLAAAATDTVDEWFEHANKPEWGRGRVVRRFDDKLEIEFDSAGTKVLKTNSPLLRPVASGRQK